MARTKKQAKRNVKQARGKVDKAQTKLIMENAKAIAEMKGNTELKYNFYEAFSVPVSYPQMINVSSRRTNIIPITIGGVQGQGDTDRIGDKIALKTIQLRYALNLENGAVASADNYNRIRVIMFWDTMPYEIQSVPAGNVAVNYPEWQMLLQSINVNNGGAPEVMALSTKDHDLSNRFRFIYDEVHTLASNGNSSNQIGLGPRSVTNDHKFFKKYDGRLVTYKAGGNVPVNRQLYLALISDSTAIGHPLCDYFIKVQYTDK